MIKKGEKVKLKTIIPIGQIAGHIDSSEFLKIGDEGVVEICPDKEAFDSYYIKFGKHMVRFQVKEPRDILETIEKI